MIDPPKLEANLRNLDRYVGFLRLLADEDRDEFLADFTKTGSARYYLQVAIECCLDAANHLISAKSLRAPADYADAFVVLGEADIVPADFVQTLQQMARMRNRLVHLYWDIDDELLFEILSSHLDDFARFKDCVVAQLEPDDEG